MNWHDFAFWRRPPIAGLAALADFVDEQSAYLVQKGIHDYSRALSGHYAKVLFSEREFLDALERSRWSAYPIGLAMVGEVVEGVLRPHAGDNAALHCDSVRDFVLSIFDRYPAPTALGALDWQQARAELARRLQLTGLHPPKRAIDIAEPYARLYWDLMPFHKDVRSRDLPTTRSYLQVMLCNIHDELTRRADVPALVRLLAEAEVRHAAGVRGEVGSARGEGGRQRGQR
jgi:hypothetical protein